MTKQSSKGPVPKQPEKRLTPLQRENRDKKKAVQRFLAQEAKQRAKDHKRAQDAQYKAILKNVRGKGIYDPKEIKLTKYRRAKAKSISQQWGEFLNPAEFFFIPAPKKDRANILERATGLSIPKSKTGLFVAKGGHKRASLKKDEKRGEYFIERSGKTKQGPNKGRKYKSVLPLASIDQFDQERERIERAAQRLMPLKDKETLIFTVHENGVEGMSGQSFGDVQSLMQKIEQYRKTTAGKLQFMRHVEVQKFWSYTEYAKVLNARDDVTKGGRRKTRKVKSSGKFDTRGKKG